MAGIVGVFTKMLGIRQGRFFSRRSRRCALGLWLGASWLAWPAVAGTLSKMPPEHFPMPSIVKEQVQFWEKIFYHFPSHAVVIHDSHHPEHIIDIIDFRKWPQKKKAEPSLSKRQRDRVAAAYQKRYKLALRRFQRMGQEAIRFGAIEKRVYSIYSRSKHSLARLYQGKVALRLQSGLADEFVIAAKRAQEYLPYMEATFRAAGVPPRITRLAFVESMFNPKARSKVGASGVWQFMPATARYYMLINKLVDERNSPFKATQGAAKLLADNYRNLRSWPLAITAYNHGKAGIERAVKQVGSARIENIIFGYQSPSFGYASRNFYGEFLAAANIYERLIKERRVPQSGYATPILPIRLPGPLSVHQLLKVTPLDAASLRAFNHCLRSEAFTRYRHMKLPKAFEIFVPERIADKVLSSLNNFGKRRYASIP